MLSTEHAPGKPVYYVKCFRVRLVQLQSHEDKPPRTDTRHRVKNAVKKCTKTIKKQAKNLHKRKACIIFVSNKRTKDPAIRGMIKKSNTMKTTFNSLKTQVNKATGQQFIQTAKKTTFWKQMKEIDETSGKTLRANFMALVYGTSDINVINK